MNLKMTSYDIERLFKDVGVRLETGEARLIRFAATSFQVLNAKGIKASKHEQVRAVNHTKRLHNMAKRHVNFPKFTINPLLTFDFPEGPKVIL